MTKAHPLVYFIIINHNGKLVILDCLKSVLNQDHPHFKVLVVDNNSSDESVSIIRRQFPRVEIMALDKNYGFARANNMALNLIRQEHPEFVAFINSDAVLDRAWLGSLLAFMARHSYDGTQSIITTSDSTEIIDSAGIGISKSFKIYDRLHKRPLHAEVSDKQILGPCFAAALWRAKAMDVLRIGQSYFDDDLKTFYEDVDFCLRARSHGFVSALLAKPLCHHRRSFTADRNPWCKYFLIGRNYFLILGKHFPSELIIRSLCSIASDRSRLLVQTVVRPDLFACFLCGSLWGILRALRYALVFDQASDNKAPQKPRLLWEIRQGIYE